jgi:ferredoxin
VSFPGTRFRPVELGEGAELSENLTVQNSPIMFGCRTGICGTCLIKVTHVSSLNPLHERSANEKEYLEELFPHETHYRLACQIKINANIHIEKEKI